MKVQYSNAPRRVRKIVGVCLIGVLTGAACVQQSLAQVSASPSQSLAFTDPLKQIRWISGPQSVGIGDIADVKIPDGYRFADAHGARMILDNANAPVPNDLAGVLADNAGTWWAIIEFAPNGYVKSDELANIDSSSILATVKKELQNQNGGITSLNWQSKPVFDAETHTLSWVLQAQSASGKSLNEGVALLGRNGILQITAVRPYPLGNSPSLAQLVSQNVSFKEGQRYTDYQKGDKLGDIGLASLIAGDNGESHPIAGTVAWVYWVYSGLAVCGVVGGVMLLSMRKKSRRRVRRHGHTPAPATAAAAVPVAPVSATVAAAAATTTAAMAHPPVAVANGKVNGGSQAKTTTNGTNGTKHLHRNRRKKVFDYPKFYTNVMRELSFHSYEASPLIPNGNGKGRNGYANGHTNGHANGTNGHNGGNGTNGNNGTNGSGVNETIKSGIEELIATQKALIQEQKCLLEQQTRLIEEKRWLIEEQTAFLKGQAGMMSDGQPLKFE